MDLVPSYLKSKTLSSFDLQAEFAWICSIDTWLSWLEACFTSAAARGFARWSMPFANAGWAFRFRGCHRMSWNVSNRYEIFRRIFAAGQGLAFGTDPSNRDSQPWTLFRGCTWRQSIVKTLHDCTPHQKDNICCLLWMALWLMNVCWFLVLGFPMPHDPMILPESVLISWLCTRSGRFGLPDWVTTGLKNG